MIQAVYLDDSVVLNTTVSNSSMTFSVPVNVDQVTITEDNITLTNVLCYNTAPNVAEVFHDNVNENQDSANYCVPSTYTQATNSLCPDSYRGFSALGSSFFVVCAILGILILITAIGGAIYLFNNEGSIDISNVLDLEWSTLTYIIMGVFVLVVVLISAIFAVSIPCGFNI